MPLHLHGCSTPSGITAVLTTCARGTSTNLILPGAQRLPASQRFSPPSWATVENGTTYFAMAGRGRGLPSIGRRAQRLPASQRFSPGRPWPNQYATSEECGVKRDVKRLAASQRFQLRHRSPSRGCSTPSGITAVLTGQPRHDLIPLHRRRGRGATRSTPSGSQRFSRRMRRAPRIHDERCAQRLPASQRFSHGPGEPGLLGRGSSTSSGFRHHAGSHRAGIPPDPCRCSTPSGITAVLTRQPDWSVWIHHRAGARSTLRRSQRCSWRRSIVRVDHADVRQCSTPSGITAVLTPSLHRGSAADPLGSGLRSPANRGAQRLPASQRFSPVVRTRSAPLTTTDTINPKNCGQVHHVCSTPSGITAVLTAKS